MIYDNISEAKKQIFTKSVELFSEQTFELVTISDIAKSIGKSKSSIYNHFTSKQAILDDIYDFFCCHFNDQRRSIEEIEPIILSGSVMDIIHSVFYLFDDYDDIMIPIFRILHQRKYHDEKARNIILELTINEGIRYGRKVFDRAVTLGRLKPFNTYILAVLCNNSRLILYEKWVLNPTIEYFRELIAEEDMILSYVSRLLTDGNDPL